MTALVLADLRGRWRSLVALAGGCFVLLMVLSGTYSAYGGAAGFSKSFGSGSMPQLFAAFSGSGSADVFSPAHFLAFGFGHPLFLVLTLSVAITSGVAAVASDVESGRSELLFTAPIRRTAVLDARLAGWAMAQAAVLAAALVAAIVGSRLSGDLSGVGLVVPVRVAVQLASLVFFVAAVAFAASARMRSRGKALGVAVGVTAGSYVANLTGLLWHPLAFAQRLNPFGYYTPAAAADHFAWGDAAVLLGAGVVLVGLAHRWLSDRDLA